MSALPIAPATRDMRDMREGRVVHETREAGKGAALDLPPAGQPAAQPLRIVVLGLSITSSWGNGHATTYRALLRELTRRGHDVLFLERDVPWYASQRDLPQPPFGRTVLYDNLDTLRSRHEQDVAEADLVIVGSYVPQGIEVGDWVHATAQGPTAFYDIDTPVTLARLEASPREDAYLAPRQIADYDLYLSFTGGPVLQRLEQTYGSPAARVLYCSVDPDAYYPEAVPVQWDLGYMGTYSDDRQPTVQRLLLEPAHLWRAGRFTVAGPQYPEAIRWPANVHYTSHLPPAEHRAFYNAQRFTLNVTRADMIRAGWSPSVRLFEAAACGTPIISDRWCGIGSLFTPNREIFLADSSSDVLRFLRDVSESDRQAMGEQARQKVLHAHTAAHRARELEGYALEAIACHAQAPVP